VRVVECKIEDPSICNIKKDDAKFTMIHTVIPEDLPWPTPAQVRMHLPDIYYKYNHIRKMKWSSIQSFSDSQYLGFVAPHPHN